MRIIFILAYNGARFQGLQQQKRTNNTVLGTLSKAMALLNISSPLVASGRTDSNVHATKQIIHTDIPTFWSNLDKLHAHLQRKLPPSITVRQIKHVHDTFHARYDAYKRQYRYIINLNPPCAFGAELYYYHNNALDLQALNQALLVFVGTHDFSLFLKQGSHTKTAVRTIYNARAYQHKNYIIISLSANGFLRAQVRLMIAAVLAFNDKKIALNAIKEQLHTHTKHIKKPAPAAGLYLTNVFYKNY